MFALLDGGAATLPEPRAYPQAVTTEMLPSAVMMISEAVLEGGDPASVPLSHEQPLVAAGNPLVPTSAGGGDPCPKCGRALAKTGRHFHIRKCKGDG
jgi:hypothetical protein